VNDKVQSTKKTKFVTLVLPAKGFQITHSSNETSEGPQRLETQLTRKKLSHLINTSVK